MPSRGFQGHLPLRFVLSLQPLIFLTVVLSSPITEVGCVLELWVGRPAKPLCPMNDGMRDGGKGWMEEMKVPLSHREMLSGNEHVIQSPHRRLT